MNARAILPENMLRAIGSMLRCSICALTITHGVAVSAQTNPDGTEEMSIMVHDRFGNTRDIRDIAVPDVGNAMLMGGGGGIESCGAGIFNLVFTHNDLVPMTGFYDPTWGQTYRDIACLVFTDLSQLIVPADNPYTNAPNTQPFVNIEVRLPTNPAPGAVGMGSSFHSPVHFQNAPWNITQPINRVGILDGEVWKTINGGFDSWAGIRNILPFNGFGFPPNHNDYFHGFVHIDFDQFPAAMWHLSPSAPPPVPPLDLYTVIFHEAMHALGILSWMDAIGNSQSAGTTYYYRYDTRLQISGTPVLDAPYACGGATLNGGLDLNELCTMFFVGPNAGSVSVHNPDTWTGSSFEHFDGNCANEPFLMHPGPILNQSRIPLQEEASALCDINYRTTTNIGTQPAWVGTVVTNYQACGHRLAGVDDVFRFASVQAGEPEYYICRQGQGGITIDDFLSNDEDESTMTGVPDQYACMTILRGGGTVTPMGPGEIVYTPAPGFLGWAVLRYLPYSSTWDEYGNKTYIFIQVTLDDECAEDCNIVIGGDFENLSLPNNFCEPYSDWRISESNSPDLIQWNGFSWPNYFVGCQPAVTPTPSHNGAPANTRYVSIAGGASGNQEGLLFELCSPMIPGMSYELDFWAMMNNSGCGAMIDFRAFENRPCNWSMNQTDLSGAVMNCFGVDTYAEPVLNGPIAVTDSWSNYNVTFVYSPVNSPTLGSARWITAFLGGFPVSSPRAIFVDDIAIRPLITATATITPSCNGQNDGSISLDVHYYPDSYTILWSNSANTPTITNLAPGTYTVTITDTELGCATLVEEFVVPDADCDGPFTLAKWVTPNSPPNTYAGAPVMFTIQACNNDVVDHVVEITDDLPADFVLAYNNPNNPYSPTATITIPAGGCVTTEITGYFTQIGPHTNEVTLEQEPGVSLSADATITLLDGCPMIVYGNGGCEPGQIVDMCLGMHTQLTDVESVVYYMVYPDFLVPPPPGPLNVGTTITAPPSIQASIDQVNTSIGFPIPLAWVPGYNAVLMEVFFNPPVSPSPPYQFFCIDFTIGTAGVPAGTNAVWTWASTTAPSNMGWNRVTVNMTGGSVNLWTQAYHILFTGCPDIPPPNAEFTIDQVLCTGEVTVTGTETDPNAIHIWTWGDDRTTPINGAPTYTYNYFSTITDNQGWPVSPPIGPAPPGTYTITHTVVLNGVASSSTQQVTVEPCCQANTVIPDGSLASVVGSAFSGTVDIQGQFIVDDDVLFQNCQVYMEPGAEIIVQNGWTLDLDNASFTACNGIMWKSITAEDGSTVRIRRSYMDDAESTVAALDGSTVWIDRTQFHNNRVGVGIPDNGLPYNNVACWVSNSTFYSAGPMPQPYTGQASAVGGVGFAAVDVRNTTLDFSGGNNIIHSLSNGIVAHRSDVNVNGCQMLNIQPDAAYAYTGNGAGIYARGGLGFFSLKQQGYGVNGLHSFQDCRWGIYTEYMSVKSTDNRMFDVGTAYRVDRSGYMDVDILNNKVSTRYNGIDLRANDGAAHILVQGNDITFGNDPSCTACRGWYAVYVSEGNYVAPNSRIQNNTIHFLPQYASRYGIGLFAADRWVVAENDLGMTSNAFNRTGIWLNGCRATEVSCNTVNSTGTTYPVDAQAAIRNNMGREPLISCNEMDQTANGILFNGVAYNTDVRGNQFHNHRWPLHLDATAIIDAQTLKGNLWDPNAAAPVWGAWYEVSNLQSASSLFRYDPALIGIGTTQPPSWSPPNWFTFYPGTNYDCADHHGTHYCSQFGGERCKDCIRELDEKIASDSLENNPYTDETKWMLAADLYKKLDESPALLDSLPELDAFYTTLQGSATAAFKAIADDQLALYGLDSTVVAQLQANRTQIETFMTLVKAGLEQLGDSTLTPAQRQTILGGISGYRQNINSLTAWNATALQVASTSKVLTADGVKAANSGIATSELIETNEKGVNDIYLATIGKDVDDFTATQTDDLFTIANQCPMVGGNAVFKARSLYWLIDDTYDFDDQLLCLQHGIIVKSLTQQPLNGVAVVPNPASDEATLVLDHELEEPGTFVVYDAVGAEVMRQAIPIEMPRMAFSTASLAPALYHYQVRGPSGILGVGKLTIVR